MIDLAPHHLETVKRILREHVPDCEVRAFGSRVTWTASDYSDLDLVVVGEGALQRGTVALLKEAFEESNLPMRVDVLEWHRIPQSFRDVIGGNQLVLVKGTERVAIEAAQVIEELIALAGEMREADRRGEDLGLTDDELSFYDALETNDSAVKKNATIDWTMRADVRARLRVLVKRILLQPPLSARQAGGGDPDGAEAGGGAVGGVGGVRGSRSSASRSRRGLRSRA